ncbi:22468_t:CDS:2 [Rhizophagus irregularis]|nr:22468_t:CDS:2 [Rhizophagus irregularis]
MEPSTYTQMQNQQQRQKTPSPSSTTIMQPPPTPPSTTNNTPAPNGLTSRGKTIPIEKRSDIACNGAEDKDTPPRVKDVIKLKKPKNPYLCFAKANRDEFRIKYPDALSREITSLLGKAWKELSDEEKKPYIKMARDEAKEYNLAINEFKELEKNIDNEEKEDLNFSHGIPSEQFVDFKSLLGSPISFGPFEANLEAQHEILSQGRDYVPSEIKSSESPLGIYQAKESTTRAAQSQLNSQSNYIQFDLQTSQHQSQNKPHCQYNTNMINSQCLNQQKNQLMNSQEGSQVQEVMPLSQQNQICQQPFQQPMPYASSHMQPFDHKLYPNNCNSSHDMKIQNMPEISNCPPTQPYMPPSTSQIHQMQQISCQPHQQQMMFQHHMMQPSWQIPSFIPTQTNHQIMPLQPSTRYNQMQYNQMQYNQMQYSQPMNSYREMLPLHSTGIGMPQFMSSHQMQHDQMPQVMQPLMMNDKQPSVYQMDMYDMRQRQNPILQHHQMNWRTY